MTVDILAEEVMEDLGPALVARGGPLHPRFRGVAVDSRLVERGFLFVALPGQRHDGHHFLEEAVSRGAWGVLVSRPTYGWEGVTVFQVRDTLEGLQRLAAGRRRRHPQLTVVGITGSVGKTTCKELTAAVLARRYSVLKSPGNLNTEVGLPLALMGLEAHHHVAVLEMGMFARGDIALLCRLANPQVGVVTNVAPVHLERLGSMGAIAAAKGELLESLPREGVAVVNGDCPWTRRVASRTRARVVTFGLGPTCQVRGQDVRGEGLAGFRFRLCTPQGEIDVRCPMPGRHNVYNALAAAAVGLCLGMELPEVATALSQARTHLRLQVLPGPHGSTIIDDSYNASPPSVLAALALLAETPGRRLALLGDMLELGDYDVEGHRLVGEEAGRVVDVLVVVGERAHLVAAAARRGGRARVMVVRDKQEAAAVLRKELGPGDHLLVKGSRALALEEVVEALRS
jgi:UDP-N-acetylmuramoyl-tripeptide--D-alanyl-D-alanine ligase